MEIKDVEENEKIERRKNKRYNIPTVVNCKFFEEVTNGYVPKSMSSSDPCAPSAKIVLPDFIA